MPSPERHQGGPPEGPHRQEPQPIAYQRVARFTGERAAAQAYTQAQDAIFAAPCDISAYRFLLDRVSHVALIGAPPPAELDQHLGMLLAEGTPVTLPRGVLIALVERRRQMRQRGLWTEGHYRPGRPL